MGIAQIITLLVTLTEVYKRFIPKKARKIVVPAVNLAGGVGLAWAYGGHEIGLQAVSDGLSAGVGALGAYKIPKEIGKILFKEK